MSIITYQVSQKIYENCFVILLMHSICDDDKFIKSVSNGN